MEAKKIPSVSVFRFLIHSTQILKNPLPFHHKNFQTKGDTFRLKLGFGNSVIFSRDAGFAQYALQKNQRNFTKSPIQLIQPAFHKKQLVNLLATVQNAIKVELAKIETEKPIDIFPIFNDLAFQTVVKSLFSSAIDVQEIKKLQHITESAQQMLVRELRQPYLGWWFRLSGKIKKHLCETEQARIILKKLINQRKESGKREDDLLDMLLEARYEDGSEMEEKQLIDEILILFTAGHETTSNALTFTCELLARNVQIQEKLFSEIIEAEKNSETLMDFIKNCPFTKNVIEESLRLYPPAYFIDRVNIEEDEFNGMKIPKNSNLLFSLLEIHTNPKYWDEPQKFKPERIKTYKISEKKKPVQIKPLITLKPKNAILEFNFR